MFTSSAAVPNRAVSCVLRRSEQSGHLQLSLPSPRAAEQHGCWTCDASAAWIRHRPGRRPLNVNEEYQGRGPQPSSWQRSDRIIPRRLLLTVSTPKSQRSFTRPTLHWRLLCTKYPSPIQFTARAPDELETHPSTLFMQPPDSTSDLSDDEARSLID